MSTSAPVSSHPKKSHPSKPSIAPNITPVSSTPKAEISPTISIQELADNHPELIEILIVEYGFHCVGCFASQFETLEEGARVHGIAGGDFEELLAHLQSLAAIPSSSVSS